MGGRRLGGLVRFVQVLRRRRRGRRRGGRRWRRRRVFSGFAAALLFCFSCIGIIACRGGNVAAVLLLDDLSGRLDLQFLVVRDLWIFRLQRHRRKSPRGSLGPVSEGVGARICQAVVVREFVFRKTRLSAIRGSKKGKLFFFFPSSSVVIRPPLRSRLPPLVRIVSVQTKLWERRGARCARETERARAGGWPEGARKKKREKKWKSGE